MFPEAFAATNIKYALEIVYAFALADQFFLVKIISCNSFINGYIIIDMTRDFSRFRMGMVSCRSRWKTFYQFDRKSGQPVDEY